jgi:hypothetical protein
MRFIPPPQKYLESSPPVPKKWSIRESSIWFDFLSGPHVTWHDTLVEEHTTYSADEYDRKPLSLAERIFIKNTERFEVELVEATKIISEYRENRDIDSNRVKFYANLAKNRYEYMIRMAKYYRRYKKKR